MSKIKDDRETSSLISIETIKAIIKKELGVNLYFEERVDIDYYFSKNLKYSVMNTKTSNYESWFVRLSKETKSGVNLELINHNVKTEKELLDLIKKFKKVRKML